MTNNEYRIPENSFFHRHRILYFTLRLGTQRTKPHYNENRTRSFMRIEAYFIILDNEKFTRRKTDWVKVGTWPKFASSAICVDRPVREVDDNLFRPRQVSRRCSSFCSAGLVRLKSSKQWLGHVTLTNGGVLSCEYLACILNFTSVAFLNVFTLL